MTPLRNYTKHAIDEKEKFGILCKMNFEEYEKLYVGQTKRNKRIRLKIIRER